MHCHQRRQGRHVLRAIVSVVTYGQFDSGEGRRQLDVTRLDSLCRGLDPATQVWVFAVVG